ncbi:winged helix-turn-helix domain-containing protein [Halobellus captivus]|uniref:winged helix-turn-helix domain-containing protein n=1 Tax=Halobellus captivus TaxID=2592614 RepID=UPI001396B4D0|nr:winged helix-turn-helix domain-containing protein [Halobellus captivus]
MTDSDWEAGNLLDVLGDPLCRQALVIAHESPVSATTLANRLDVSPPTVYRRVNSLVEHELVQEHRRIDADGNHYRLFEASLDRVEIALTRDGYRVSIRHRQDLGDRFDEFWTAFGSSEFPSRTERSTDHDSRTDPSPL